MNLNKDKWTNKDIKEFIKYLESLQNKDRILWTKNIINTNMTVLAIKSPVIKDIVKDIYKGNFISFLDYMAWDYYENTSINALLITKIKDFDIMKKYLDIYSSRVDNWASCDVLKFNTKDNEPKYLELVNEYIKSDKPFVRRIGIIILFSLIKNENYIDDILKVIDSFYFEEEYYVNMVNSWLLCECFIRYRTKTLNYLKDNHLNSFTLNKFISKCRDSYRVCKEDKKMLLKFKK